MLRRLRSRQPGCSPWGAESTVDRAPFVVREATVVAPESRALQIVLGKDVVDDDSPRPIMCRIVLRWSSGNEETTKAGVPKFGERYFDVSMICFRPRRCGFPLRFSVRSITALVAA